MTSEVLQNPYFVRLYCIHILTKHIFNYKIVKHRSSFFLMGAGGGGRAERQWLKENLNQKMLNIDKTHF